MYDSKHIMAYYKNIWNKKYISSYKKISSYLRAKSKSLHMTVTPLKFKNQNLVEYNDISNTLMFPKY